MTKPEFDKLYCEKLAKGLDSPLDKFIDNIRIIGDDSSFLEFLGHVLVHKMVQNVVGRKAGDSEIFIVKSSWCSENQGITMDISIRINQ